jgi:excisionase family DNA binding protein
MRNRITLREAAKNLGVSLPTVRRLIARGSIQAQQFHGPHGLRWEIEVDSIDVYRENLILERESSSDDHVDAVDQACDVVDAVMTRSGDVVDHTNDTVDAVWILGEDAVEPVHGTSSDAVDQRHQTRPDAVDQGPNRSGREQSVVPLHAHLRALDISNRLLDRAQKLEEALAEVQLQRDQERRRAESLTLELTGYKRALGEQAESLIEERARRLEAEELGALKISTPNSSGPQWGSRLKRWLGLKTG